MSHQNLDKYHTPKGFRGRSSITVQLWRIVYVTVFKTSPQFMYGWRRFLLRSFGATIGTQVLIRPSAQITYPWKLFLGDYCWIGDEVVLYTLGDIIVGDHTVISQRSYICTGTHDYNTESFEIKAHTINIGSKCWLATDVYVAPGISIGNSTVVGARSSVFKDLSPNKIYIGSPTKEIKDRFE